MIVRQDGGLVVGSAAGALTGHDPSQRLASPANSGTPQAGRLATQALVAQGIEQRFPKPCVAGSIPAGGTTITKLHQCMSRLRYLARKPSRAVVRR